MLAVPEDGQQKFGFGRRVSDLAILYPNITWTALDKSKRRCIYR